MWTLWWGVASAACPTPIDVAGLDADLKRAEEAFANLDATGFDRALDEAALGVGCLSGTITPAVAARFHRLQGLRFFAARDAAHALASFTASRSLDSAWAWPADLLPPGHA